MISTLDNSIRAYKFHPASAHENIYYTPYAINLEFHIAFGYSIFYIYIFFGYYSSDKLGNKVLVLPILILQQG